MVHEFDLEEGGGFLEALGYAAVGLAGGGISRGMIVGEDEGMAEVDDDRAQDFAWVGEGFVDETARDFFHVDEAEAAVEDENMKDFLSEVGGERGEKFIDDFWAVESDGVEVFSGDAGAKLEGSEELAGFGQAEAVLKRNLFDAEFA